MTDIREFEIFITVDADGDYEVAPAHDDSLDRYGEHIGGSGERRTYLLRVMLPLPEVAEVTITSQTMGDPVAAGLVVQPIVEGE